MAKNSRVKKRRSGCLGGCLLRIVLLLGLCALLFVGACYIGVIRIDESTGAPSVSFDDVRLPESLDELNLPQIDLSALPLPDISLPSWAFGVSGSGLTVKTLHAGAGEAVLICCDGYTMLLGGGENGLLTSAQLLLCGAKNLSAAAAMSLERGQTGGMSTVLSLTKPAYLLYPDTQTKDERYHAMLSAAQDAGTQLISPDYGLTFSLGRATVRVVGPRYKNHTDERDDGLAIRVDYGEKSVLIMGTTTQAAERELVSSGAPMDADVLICGLGGGEEATSGVLVSAVSPDIAIMTGKQPANLVKVRLEREGCEVYTMEEFGLVTVTSDGQTIEIQP